MTAAPPDDDMVVGNMVASNRVVGSGFGAGGPVGTGVPFRRENPARPNEIVGEMAACTADEVSDIVEAAAAAQRDWARRPTPERVDLLRRAADAVGASAKRLAPVLTAELGKPIDDSAGEMGFAAAFAHHVATRVEALTAESVVDDDAGRVVVTHEPHGVVAAIVPWNAPLILSSLKVAPAVATGNTVVVKPSPLAPFAVTEALAAMAAELPPGVISVVHGGADVGEALVGHRDVAKVAFTGGEVVGRSVLRTAAERITPTVMELGGNDAAVILDDLTLDDDVMERMVFGAFLTSGQVCMAAKRIYVPEHRLGELVDRFRETADRVLVGGDPADRRVTIGPLVTRAHRDRVADLVAGAVDGGATAHALGTFVDSWDPEEGYFLRPTLVVGAAADSTIVTTEQFGPTVPVVGYDDLDRAVEWANASDLGLASSVWSDDEERAFDVGRRLRAGMTFVNCHNRAGMSLRVPFGGVKRSGFGREFADAGIAEYTATHALHAPASVRAGTRGRAGAPSAGALAGRAYPT